LNTTKSDLNTDSVIHSMTLGIELNTGSDIKYTDMSLEKLDEQSKPLIIITESAAKKVLEVTKQQNKVGYGLRVFVRGGGCSGLTYGLSLEREPELNDIVIEQKGLRIFVDGFSAEYIKGSVVDYVESFQASGFKIDNPNAVQTCGCGHSFRTTARPGKPQPCNHTK
jgi:iron-sulfur cluster assembly accessory protein